MESITKEELERADDFIFHLSEKQMADWLADFRKRQYNIGTQMIRDISSWKKLEQKDIHLRIMATMITCLENYDEEIALIKQDEIERALKAWPKKFDKFDERTSGFDCLVIFAELESQPMLPFYIGDKFLLSEDIQKIFDMNERAELASCLLCLCFVLNDKFKKFLPKVKMYIDDRGMVSTSKETVDIVNAKYKDVEEIKNRISDTGDEIIKLQENFNKILEPYDTYFKGVLKHSKSFDSYLYTMSKLESKMQLGLDDKQRKTLHELTELSVKVTEDATNAMRTVAKNKEAIFKFDTVIDELISYIDKTIPDTKKCLEEVERFENVV